MRLTSRMKENITAAVIGHAFDDKFKAMHKREEELSLRLYRSVVPKDLEKEMEHFEEEWGKRFTFPGTEAEEDRKLPMFTRISAFSVYRSLEQREILSHVGRYICMTAGRIWPTTQRTDVSVENFGQEMFDEVEAFLDDMCQLTKQRQEQWRAVEANLKVMSTVKKLRDQWPEVMTIAEPIIEENAPQPKLPAHPIAELNAALDLPVEEKELENA